MTMIYNSLPDSQSCEELLIDFSHDCWVTYSYDRTELLTGTLTTIEDVRVFIKRGDQYVEVTDLVSIDRVIDKIEELEHYA